jgi:class 3 adenylate cyclase
MADLPTGTVTFLFTDIEGSTPLWEREPDQMRLALARHDAILRTTIASESGHAYKTIGDAFQAAFALPAQALAAALAAQRAFATQTWETSEPLRVRMGIHVGPAVAEGNDYRTTHTLNRVARIMAAGHGGQILLSREVADVVRRELPTDVTLRDMGTHRMKGLIHLEHLFQLVTPGLPADFPPLQMFRGYDLRQQLGVGGFCSVYRATQLDTGREVAVKIILPAYANHPDFIRRFEAEAQMVAQLEHPHIVPLYDHWRGPGGAYLVMRYVRGGSLQTALRGAPWALERSTRLLDQITSALAFAHHHNIIHRDLRPANILLDEQGNAYLTDFSIATDLHIPIAADPTPLRASIGSPIYLAPEQITDQSITPQTDIYSLGMVLYEVLTGVHPFGDVPPAERLAKQLHGSLPSLRARRPDLPLTLDAIIQQATAKYPADRYPDVLSMAWDWQRALVTLGSGTVHPLVANQQPLDHGAEQLRDERSKRHVP